jgi:hypothetical protein
MAGISFNIHPRWVEDIGLEKFLAPLQEVGLDTLEFELDSHLPDWQGFQPLMEEANDLGIHLCFHAPYRGRNCIEGFSRDRRNELIGLIEPMLALAQGWAERKAELMNVVMHGGVSASASREALLEDTSEFLKWSLDRFPSLRLALENNHPPVHGEIKVGATREGYCRSCANWIIRAWVCVGIWATIT